MAKARRRSQTKRVVDRLERTLRGEETHIVDHIQAVLAEHERRRFWIRLGCPVGPLAT